MPKPCDCAVAGGGLWPAASAGSLEQIEVEFGPYALASTEHPFPQLKNAGARGGGRHDDEGIPDRERRRLKPWLSRKIEVESTLTSHQSSLDESAKAMCSWTIRSFRSPNAHSKLQTASRAYPNAAGRVPRLAKDSEGARCTRHAAEQFGAARGGPAAGPTDRRFGSL